MEGNSYGEWKFKAHRCRGAGAMTEVDKEALPENMVLSNRDKAQHSRKRGLDSKTVQTEQFHDHEANHLDDDEQ